MKQEHKKKVVAPIIVTISIVLYYIFYFCFLMAMLDGVFKYLFGILPILFSVVAIGVCIDRIVEIEEGEEDDLSQY